jgi:hypothetical protein
MDELPTNQTQFGKMASMSASVGSQQLSQEALARKADLSSWRLTFHCQ